MTEAISSSISASIFSFNVFAELFRRTTSTLNGSASYRDKTITSCVAEDVSSGSGEWTGEIARLFDVQNEYAKDYAYGLAEEIKKELDADDSDATSNTVDDEDRQESFVYDPSDTSGNGGPTT